MKRKDNNKLELNLTENKKMKVNTNDTLKTDSRRSLKHF